MKTTAIIVAGGSGLRFGNKIPKQFMQLGQMPVIMYSINLFAELESIDSIVIPAHPEWQETLKLLCKEYNLKKKIEIIDGGKERQDSVYNALNTDTVQNSDIILVHDSVRPFVSNNLVENIISATILHGAAIPAIRPKDTIKEATEDNFVLSTLNRSNLYCIQTPQGFWRELLYIAYKNAIENSFITTDDSSIVEFSGHKVKIIDGEPENFKITDRIDFLLAETICNERK